MISGHFGLDDAVDCSSGSTVRAGDLAQALSVLAVPNDGRAVEIKGPASDMRSFQAGAPHAGAHPLDDQAAFQLGNGADDHDDGAAQRTAGVDLLAEADELDAKVIQFVEHLQEVDHRPGDSIESPDKDDIELASAGIGHQVIQPRTARLHSGEPVGILLHDLEATLGGQLAQIE